MFVAEAHKDAIDSIMEDCKNEFALEAYRYNNEINNWDNPPLLLFDDSGVVQGILYYRHFDDISQIVNVFSNIKGGGTTLFEYFNENIGREYTYLYMSDKALGFYKKFGLEPNVAEKPSKEFQFCMYHTRTLNMVNNHSFIKTKI